MTRVAQVGVDVGGTFTDVVALDGAGRVHVAKVPTTPDDQSRGFLAGIERLIERGLACDATTELVHGTTAGTNAVLERRGAVVALVTTKGFGDVLELQNQERFEVWNLNYRKPEPLVSRRAVVEVDERILADGRIHRPLSDEALEAVVDDVRAIGAESVAVCLLHGYRNPIHERSVRDRLIDSLGPGVHVVASSDVVPQFREYDRASTTVVSAYIGPVIARYLARLTGRLLERGLSGRPLIMHSTGGVLSVAETVGTAVGTVMSGPSGGVAATVLLGQRSDEARLISFDMGGTSTDVCVIEGASPAIATRTLLGGLPIITPMYRIRTVGAGGGSIAAVDEAGLLRVGPESAGSRPGPVCYGHGGTEPTVTDALCALGVLRDGRRYGGEIVLDRAAATAALAKTGEPLAVAAPAFAGMVVRVAVHRMAETVRELTLREGLDPREFALVAFGGSGPACAALVADELEVTRVIVPPSPGVFSALGLLCTDLRQDRVVSELVPLDALDDGALDGLILAAIERCGAPEGASEALSSDVRREVSASLRYLGQASTVAVPAEVGVGVVELADRFHVAHRERYGFDDRSSPVELVDLRVSVSVARSRPARMASADADAGAEVEQGTVHHGDGEVACRFVPRKHVGPDPIAGPLVIEEETATTWVPPGWTVRLAAEEALMLERVAR